MSATEDDPYLFLSETGYLYEQERKKRVKNPYSGLSNGCLSNPYIDDPSMIKCYACSGYRYRIPTKQLYKPCKICNEIPFGPEEEF